MNSTEIDLFRVIVTGSRDWQNEKTIHDALEAVWSELGPFVLVHGAARGADQMAEVYQASRFRLTESHPADWERYGKRAGFVRNKKMVDAGADLCLAFIRNESRGASMCADLAEKAGIGVARFIEVGS